MKRKSYQLIEVLPVVLYHKPEQGEKRPPETVETRVAIVRIGALLQTDKALFTVSEKGQM